MIRRNTWMLLIVFAVLLAGAAYLQRSGGLEANEEETPEPALEEQRLLDVEVEQIRSFRIEDAQGSMLGVERDAQGAWTLSEPQGGAADTARIDSALTSLSTLSVLNPLETNLALDVVGLSEPAYTLEIGLTEGGGHVIQVGEPTPTGTGYYARLDGGAPVVVSKFTIDSVAELLTSPPVAATASPAAGAGSPEETGSPAGGEAAGTPTP